jgi:outer membrane lipoprotein-sorting protein
MKCSASPWLLAALAATVFAATVRADDAQDLLKQAQSAMLNAPAMRMTVDSVERTKNRTLHMVLEIVNPDKMHMVMTVNGKVASEVISDGQKTVMRNDDGAFHPLPGNIGEMVMNARKSASLNGVAEMAANLKLLGHEDVNGTPASVYAFDTNTTGLTGTSKVWLSDKSHLPLKAERHSQGETKLSGGSPGVKVDRDATITYEYDPSIKITLPAS